jgi:cell division protein FtsI (penicillin-binding protein 3)
MAALEDGFIDLDHKVETGNGRYKFTDTWMEDSKEGGYGTITIKEAFAVSSNIAIGKTIDKYYKSNPQSFIDRLKGMRLHQPLGIEIAGEGKPYIKSADDESWSGISLPWISHGYEVQLTPLQILTFYNAVANDGKMVKPMFARSLRKGNDIIESFQPVVLKEQIASPETIKKVRKMLEEVVENGTATNLKDANYSIAGKTGTAQIANSKYGYRSSVGISHQASFCGYFPADKPKYSCIVVVNAPSRNVYYGNLVAGPIFKEIADKVYSTRVEMHDELKSVPSESLTKIPVAKNSYLNDLEQIYSQIGVTYALTAPEKEWVVPETLSDSVKLHPKSMPKNLVPNVRGMNSQDAIYLLENLGLSVEIKGRGAVKKQSIVPGRRIEKGEKIILQLA